MLETLKEEVIYYGLKMSRSGLAPASWGNISARDPDTGHIVITPSGIDYERLSVEDIVVLDSAGKVLEGEKRPSSETPFHHHIYRHRAGINGIVHTHSVYATALATLKQKIPVILGNLVTAAGGEIDVVSYTPAGSEELGRAILERIGNVAAVLIQNHGVVAIGPNLWKAFQAAAVVEDTAKIYTICRLLGEPTRVSDEEVARIRESKFVPGFPLD
jgi:ribulose-5-phosphate 4-epimerase/fuculose-1-phosphate aldolase